MTEETLVFLLILEGNLLVALVYLGFFALIRPKEDKLRQYWMHAAVMVLCPVVGPLYFLFVFLKSRFLKFGQRDLSDVEFSKRRHVARAKADEEQERNIVPVEEAILMADPEKKRQNMLNVLLGGTEQSLSAIALALESDDSEVAHYAASFLQSRLDAFRERIRQGNLTIAGKKAACQPYLDDLLAQIRDMNQILTQHVLTGVEQLDYVHQMEGLCQEVWAIDRGRLLPESCESLVLLLQNQKEYDRAEFWAERFAEQHPDALRPYRLRMKLYFETGQLEKFAQVLAQLRSSPVEIDHQMLELIRMFQGSGGRSGT